MTDSAFLAQFAPLVELGKAAMVDACEITVDPAHVDDDELDPVTGQLNPVGGPQAWYAGPCQIVWSSSGPDQGPGGRRTNQSGYVAYVPLDCPPPPTGAVLTVTAVDARSDPGLVDRTFTVERAPLKTVTVRRELILTDYQGDD